MLIVVGTSCDDDDAAGPDTTDRTATAPPPPRRHHRAGRNCPDQHGAGHDHRADLLPPSLRPSRPTPRSWPRSRPRSPPRAGGLRSRSTPATASCRSRATPTRLPTTGDRHRPPRAVPRRRCAGERERRPGRRRRVEPRRRLQPEHDDPHLRLRARPGGVGAAAVDRSRVVARGRRARGARRPRRRRRIPLWAELDAQPRPPRRPGADHPSGDLLAEGHTYAVGLRGLVDRDGAEIRPSPVFRATATSLAPSSP